MWSRENWACIFRFKFCITSIVLDKGWTPPPYTESRIRGLGRKMGIGIKFAALVWRFWNQLLTIKNRGIFTHLCKCMGVIWLLTTKLCYVLTQWVYSLISDSPYLCLDCWSKASTLVSLVTSHHSPHILHWNDITGFEPVLGWPVCFMWIGKHLCSSGLTFYCLMEEKHFKGPAESCSSDLQFTSRLMTFISQVLLHNPR